jgi:glutamine amidotransferase
MIAIIDYGMGNIHSVQKVINSFAQKFVVTDNARDLGKADKIILPGVGAFADAIEELKKRDLSMAIIEQIKLKKPFLGICLGMQLLFNRSREGSGAEGLGLIAGEVDRFSPARGLKIPHIGWNQVNQTANPCRLLHGIAAGSYVYFCHSFYALPQDCGVVAATTDYGINFTSVVCKDNIFGVQFHPEKSQSVGLRILDNFINLC